MTESEYRRGYTINKRCYITDGYRLPIVDDLLSGDDSFFVQLACLNRNQQHGLLAQDFVEQKTLLGYEFAFAIKDGAKTRWILETSTRTVDMSGEQFLHRAMEQSAVLLLQSLPPTMKEVFSAIINRDLAGPFQGIVRIFLWSHQLLPKSPSRTFFLVDSHSSACIIVPSCSERSLPDLTQLQKDNPREYNGWSENIKDKLQKGDVLVTHIPLVGFNGLYLSAYNDIFLEEGEKFDILAKDTPNAWSTYLHQLDPSRDQWERQIVSAWMLAGVAFATPLDKCYACRSGTSRACPKCDWARLCNDCNSHPSCSSLKEMKRKLLP